MRWLVALLLIGLVIRPLPIVGQEVPTLVSIKNGESVPLRTISWITSGTCNSLFAGFDGVDVLEGPPTVTFRFEPGKVTITGQNCSKKVDGGTLMATAKDVTEQSEELATLRLRIRSKTGPVQVTYRYRLLLFP